MLTEMLKVGADHHGRRTNHVIRRLRFWALRNQLDLHGWGGRLSSSTWVITESIVLNNEVLIKTTY